jgi:pyroglutamyl-peptidase
MILPLEHFQKVLQDRKIPYTISSDAGGYVCNHVFYLALHQIKCCGWDKKIKCGFMHVPLMSEQVRDVSIPSLRINVMLDAVESCLKVIKNLKQ